VKLFMVHRGYAVHTLKQNKILENVDP